MITHAPMDRIVEKNFVRRFGSKIAQEETDLVRKCPMNCADASAGQ